MTHIELFTLNYLLNAVWQVAAVFLIALLAARLARPAGPLAEHRIWVAALMVQVALPACAFAPALRGFLLSFIRGRSGHVTAQSTFLGATEGPSHSHLGGTIALSTFIAYTAILIFFTARLAYRLHRTRALRKTARPITLTGDALVIWQRFTRIFQVYDAQLASSATICGPSTIGVRHRIVLLPPALFTELPHEDLAAALAHEFAHMRRRDFATNLLYELIALPIAWHPLLWVTRLRISESREMVCDDIAAQTAQSTTRYAHSLLRLAASFSPSTPASTFHAIGIFDANALERRVMTLNRKRTLAAASRRTSIAAAVLLGAATCASAMSLRLEVPADAILRSHAVLPVHPILTATGQQPNGPVRVAGGVVAGQAISRVNPVYPAEAKEKGIEGAVVLHAIIGKDGTIQDLAIVSGPAELQQAAIDAVKQWVYKPFILNGEPVEVDTTVTVRFSLNNSAPPSPQPQGNEKTVQVHANGADAYNVGGSVRPPIVIHQADPQYTEAARKAKLSGNVVVALIVDKDGMPQDVHVARGLGNGLDQKAVEAVQQYRFKPATRDGEPVAARLNIAVNFQIF